VYGVQAFDTIPNSTQLVISALQNHVSGHPQCTIVCDTDFQLLPRLLLTAKLLIS
jgi:hypothetical protein